MNVATDVITELPKIELHVHLEGTFNPSRIRELAARAGEELPRPAEDMYVTTNLAEFLEALDWVCGLVRDTDTASEQAATFAHRLAAQGVVYAEVIINPTHWAGLDAPDLLAAVADGFERAHADGGADCRLLPSILRAQSAGDAIALVETVLKLDHPRIVGLSIDGNEEAEGPGSSRRFVEAYSLARDAGLGATAHAGESSGPEGVRDALDLLGVTRVDHGVRSADDPELLGRLATEEVTLNVCLSSNCHLVYGSIDEHPIRELIGAGVPVTINTDDPDTLRVTLSSELALAARHLGWGADELVESQRRAVRASFAPAERKAELLALLDDHVVARRDT
ncbi:MAG: adenosine deaminase [Actinomycetota bacterium]|nr:adenosine deaminase [Actinomycetota bacterium]